MKLGLIICTYKRHQSLCLLLNSIQTQIQLPDEIIIVDGSPDDKTANALIKYDGLNIKYYKVEPENRGLTLQRNLGIDSVSKTIEIIAFLDDDIILDSLYFKNLLKTYKVKTKAIAVGGYITNDFNWKRKENIKNLKFHYCFDGYCKAESKRFRIRRLIYLEPNKPPCYLPEFSHGRSLGYLPPTDNIYEVEHFMGGVSSYKASVFQNIRFSTFFEGYGLYEDTDFCFRLLEFGKLYVNTSAKCEHHHASSGRPNHFKYGKMVVRNGWYVWRLRWPNPSFKNIFKWHITTLLLTFLRFLNTFTTNNKKQAFSESLGRISGWLSLISKKPKIIK